MIVRVQLVNQAPRGHKLAHVAHVAIPRTPEAPSVVFWNGRAFHRCAGACGRELRDGDIYRECSAVLGEEINDI